MSDLKKNKRELMMVEAELAGYWKTAQGKKSPDGIEISESEARTIQEYRKRIDRIKAVIAEKEKEELGKDGSTKHKQISYERFANKKWSWKLEDVDLKYNDFGASIDINFKFGLEVRGKNSYWILEQVMLNPNTITGIKLEVTKVVTKYYELKKSLAMLIEFQFIVTTADVQVTTKAGATANLGASQKKSIGIALPVEAAKVEAGQESGVSGGLNVSYEFAKSSLQPGSRATTSRSFLCVNDGKGALSISPDVRLDANESAIGDTDPGMDPGWGNAPDWKITTNDSAFKAKIT